jgi:F0F1-type ATP synthase membrane subunit b/b'
MPPTPPTPLAAGHDAGVAALEAERTRLEHEIAAAEARTADARRRTAEMNAALHAVVVSSKERLAAMEREHERHIEMIRSTAQTEVEHILADARHRARLAPAPAAPSSGDHS